MKTNKRKGFTLVELLVVIAILAVLATVSVIGYLSFTNKAKESNDISLTTQMNLALQANEAVDGKAKTMTDALNVLSDAGLDVTKLTPTSQGYSYVYDSESGRMLLLGKDKNIIAPEGATDSNKIDTFAIVKTEEELSDWTEADYGIYLADGYTGTTELTTLTSVDVGNESIKSLTIADDSSTENAIINGNLDNLKLNVPEGSVDFYGDATFADVVTAEHSFHVYGNIDQLNVIGGKVVVENGGIVSTIDTSKATSNVEVSKENGGTIGAVVVGESENVTIGSNIEKVDISTVATGFAGGVGTENAPYLISNEEEFRNINNLSGTIKTRQYYFSQIDNFDISSQSNSAICINFFNGLYDGNGFSINYNYANSDAYINALFNHIYSGEIRNLNVVFSSTNDINGQAAIIVMDGNEVSFKNVDVYGTLKYSYIGRNQSPYLYTADNTSFIDCDAYCNIYTESYSSVFYGYPMSGQSISLTNCVFYGEIIGDEVALLFANDAQYIDDKTIVDISNVRNEGLILGYTNANLVFATGRTDSSVASIASKIISNSNIRVLDQLEGLSININNDDITITPTSNIEVSYYKIEMKQYVTWYYPSETSYGIGSTMIGFSKIITNDQVSSFSLKYYEFRQTEIGLNQTFIDQSKINYALNDSEYIVVDSNFDTQFSIVESEGQEYYLLNDNVVGMNKNEYVIISNPKPSITVYAYDSENNLLGLLQK